MTAWTIETLQQLGFVPTGWQPGRAQLTMLSAFSRVGAGMGQAAAAIATGMSNETAKGSALRYLAESRYSNTPEAALPAVGHFAFTNTGTAPYAVSPGSVVVQDSALRQFVSDEATTIPANGTPTLVQMRAALAGELGNIANDADLSLVTSLAGVTVANPSPGDDALGQALPWYDVQTGRGRGVRRCARGAQSH